MRSNPIHIVPVNDTRPHITDGGKCWCEPSRDEELVIHNAADGREFFEEDEPTPCWRACGRGAD